MKWMKLFEEYNGTKVTIDDIINCIENDGVIYTEIIKNFPNNDPSKPIKPINIDEDGVVTVDIDGNLYEVELVHVKKIEY